LGDITTVSTSSTATDHASRFLLLCEAPDFNPRRNSFDGLRAAVP
jgi:hypothetical protein